MGPSALLALQQRVFLNHVTVSLLRPVTLSQQIAYSHAQKIILKNDLAWKNTQYFATPPLVLRNNVWGTNADDLWWRITTQIWVVLLIGRAASEICFNQSAALLRPG